MNKILKLYNSTNAEYVKINFNTTNRKIIEEHREIIKNSLTIKEIKIDNVFNIKFFDSMQNVLNALNTNYYCYVIIQENSFYLQFVEEYNDSFVYTESINLKNYE